MPDERQKHTVIRSKSWRFTCACSGSSDVDGGYALVVLASSFVLLGVTIGQTLCSNLYFTVFLEVFHASHSLSSFVGSTMTTVMYLTGLLVPNILNCLGARNTIMLGGLMSSVGLVLTAFAPDIWVVLLTYGFLLGAGCCLSFCGGLKALSMYFRNRLRLATGIATCGSGMGLSAMGPLVKWSHDYYGWRGLLFINASVTLQMTLCGALVFPRVESKLQNVVPVNRAEKDHLMTYRERMVDKRVLCLCFVSFLQGMSILFLLVVLKDLLQYFGQESMYTLCIIVIGFSRIVFRIACGALTEYVSPLYVHAALLAIVAIGTFFLIVPNMGGVFYVAIAVMLGIGQAIYTTLPLVVADIFGHAEMAPTYAILQAYAGFGTIIGPAVGGHIRDVTASYNGGMILCGSILVLASATSIGLEVFERRRAQQNCLEMAV